MRLIIRIAVLFIFVSSVFFTSGQNLFGEEIQNRLAIAKTAITRLERNKNKGFSIDIIDIEIKTIKSLYKKLENEPNDSSWRAFMSEVKSVSEQRRVGSRVTIKTLKDNKPQEGATIRYRLMDDKDIKTAKNPTTTTEYFLPIGLYHIWSERRGKETSDRESIYEIIQENEGVTINEYK